MPYEIDWLLQDRIIYVYSYGHISVTDLESLVEATHTLREQAIATAPTPVPLIHSIVNTTDVTRNTAGIADLRRIFGKHKGRNLHPGWSMTVAPSPVLRFFSALVLQFLGVRGRQIATIDEALSFLSRMDDTVPSLTELVVLHQQLHNKMRSSVNK